MKNDRILILNIDWMNFGFYKNLRCIYCVSRVEFSPIQLILKIKKPECISFWLLITTAYDRLTLYYLEFN